MEHTCEQLPFLPNYKEGLNCQFLQQLGGERRWRIHAVHNSHTAATVNRQDMLSLQKSVMHHDAEPLSLR